MNPSSRVFVRTVGLTPELRAAVEQGARAVWPDVDVRTFEGVGALGGEARPREVLVLGPGVSAAERQRAAEELSPDGLPRWAVVVLDDGTASEGLWFVPPGQREPAGIAHVLALADTHHAAVREARRARGDLWTMARRFSHEMRSPLGCILTSAEVIREEMAELVPAAGALAQPITDSAHEMMNLLERITFVARASASAGSSIPVDMGLIVWAARERLAVKINAVQAEISEAPTWPPAVGRAEWLERIWQSLLENALQHAGPRPRIELGWKDGDVGETVYFVRDHGPGVAPDVVPLLLRPFHRLHENDSGRGLGLAIVQRLVDLHGGRCGYETVQPHGANFFFALPRGGTGSGH